MQIQITVENLNKEEIIAIKSMVDALAREVVLTGKLKANDVADPVDLTPNEAEAAEAVASGADIAAATEALQPPAKRTRRTKAEMEAAKQAEEIKEPATPPAATTAATTAQPLPSTAAQPATPVSIDDLRSALQAYTSAKGMPAGIELLKEFGCVRISELAAKDDGTKHNFLLAAAQK